MWRWRMWNRDSGLCHPVLLPFLMLFAKWRTQHRLQLPLPMGTAHGAPPQPLMLDGAQPSATPLTHRRFRGLINKGSHPACTLKGLTSPVERFPSGR